MIYLSGRERSNSQASSNLLPVTLLPMRTSRMTFWGRVCTILAGVVVVVVVYHVYPSEPGFPEDMGFVGSPEPMWLIELDYSKDSVAALDRASPATPVEASPESIAATRIDELFQRQSQTIEEAETQYSLRNGRLPPPNFDKWFAYAQEHKCLVDEYHQIHRDFEPFYQLAKEDPVQFKRMVELGRRLMLLDPKGMVTIKIENGTIEMPTYRGSVWDDEWRATLTKFLDVLPDMEFLINGRDEPRVVFNTQDPRNRKTALAIADTQPFRIRPAPTSDFFKERAECRTILTEKGTSIDALEDVAFINFSSSSDFTTDLYPLLSMTKTTSSCFADIMFPGQYYYDSSQWSGKFSRPNDISWEDKKAQLYWRGSSNGGTILNDNYHKFSRFRLVKIAASRPDIINARMTGWYAEHCKPEYDCDAGPIIAEYLVPGGFSPREEVYQYKFALDVDGNTFSGRYLGLLRSGSLVFKASLHNLYT
ncbi:unnamed protein product [Mycena citricolor]|uniref:Glycosyl transferase CAP10 domain-containing protein n=1 Tax=Mycena citricolor TaxID=2018698 RepID=A0AAD2HEY6_9AGAR|nr:unnamed protein product [Mycena citricolor]CAK5274432.1 unnamed protein product [Mycena citricolor]